ncbi:MAG: response regulator [PVC group bacterium]|nr:response regulator [PVC group bacterium]
MAENLMDITQVAEYLQMNKMTIYKLARQGKIPAFKVASEWRFRKDLIDSWLMSQLKDKPELEQFQAIHSPKAGKTVLIVDDDQTIQDYFERVLKEYRVIKASNGTQALELVQKERPDLVLLDIRMPGIDGIETLKRIKEIDSDISVIMLSAHRTLQTNLEAAKLGAYTSLAKPFDLYEMKSIISDAFSSAPTKRDINAE